MAQSSLFERVVATLFGGAEDASASPAEQQLIAETIEMIVETVEPRVRMHARYREKLQGPVRCTIEYLRTLGSGQRIGQHAHHQSFSGHQLCKSIG